MDKTEKGRLMLMRLARGIAFKLLLIPGISLIILSVTLVMVFSPIGLLNLFSWIVMGFVMIGLAFSWFVWASIVQVFAIESWAFTGQMRLPLAINLALTIPIFLFGIFIGFLFLQIGRG